MSEHFNIIDEPKHCSAHVELNITPEKRGVAPINFRGRAAIVTLGCAKNQVDSEVMLGVLRNSGYEIVSDLAQADVAIVNTCGFLESAVKESVDAILSVAEYKHTGRLRRLVVAGCMVERYGDDLKKELPEVDRFITTDDVLKVDEAVGGEFQRVLDAAARPYFLYDESMPRVISTKIHTAYIKIAEGCDRPCTFCIIPKIRGAMRSRTVESVVQEAKLLGEQGVKEINLVAQDLTSYGKDQKGPSLAKLLQALDQSRAVDWVRLLYAYPIGIDDELLEAISNLPSICKYLDLPLQHSSERVLKEMKRPLGRYAPRRIVEYIRTKAPQIKLRTTFIVGFPGETKEDIKDLESFIGEGHFASVGIFTYSQEAGTPAHDMEHQVSTAEKERRKKHLLQKQQKVNADMLSQYIGAELDVLVEGTHTDTETLLVGRARFQAPEVDGQVIINDLRLDSGVEDTIIPGRIGKVRITEVAGYDLVGTLINY